MQQIIHSDPNSGSEMKTDDSSSNIPLELREDFDHRNYRPLEVDVSIIMHDIQAHLLMVCKNTTQSAKEKEINLQWHCIFPFSRIAQKKTRPVL